jgi:hypothetical protein
VGIGPRQQRAEPFTVPADALQRRLADATEPPPPGVDPVLWAEPMLMWGLTVDVGEHGPIPDEPEPSPAGREPLLPGEHGLLVLDAGATGLWAFTAARPEAHLTPLPAYEAWRLILRAIYPGHRRTH